MKIESKKYFLKRSIDDDVSISFFLCSFSVNKHQAVEIKHEHYDAAAAAAAAAEHFLFPGSTGPGHHHHHHHHHPQLGSFSFPLPQAPVTAHSYQHLLNGHVNNKLMAS